MVRRPDQRACVRRPIDDGIPEHQMGQVVGLLRRERGDGGTQAEPHQGDLGDIGGIAQLLHGEPGVSDRPLEREGVALSPRITRAPIVEAEDMVAGLGEHEGQLAEGAMRPHVLLPERRTEHDAGATAGTRLGGMVDAVQRGVGGAEEQRVHAGTPSARRAHSAASCSSVCSTMLAWFSLTPTARSRRVMARTASSECPPMSKKLS